MARTLRRQVYRVLRNRRRKKAHFEIIRLPTITSAPPVAHGGMEAKIGAKKIEMNIMSPTVIPVIPVLPPSVMNCQNWGILTKKREDSPEIPVALSIYAVVGEQPSREPMDIQIASMQYASVECSKSIVTGSQRPANFAMEYIVLVCP